ncbi:hypothetical protein LTR56_022794 [Elasticomyces elasticus]|nr:hypothetical protein LTR56_022794 [Elasticomyces elasticus]KAK3624386.1 hypothetical protein LTR22_024004 [Elasticomyces elasticus]KAK4910501.1 hypothetical protein LTR49_020857 [Elasticomyces elasticus]KAK5745257.1 hypothetical protein LTS12_023189 [Elasticomyces elasticus]
MAFPTSIQHLQLSSDDNTSPTTPHRDHALFSDGLDRALSPPSSPPGFPWEQHTTRNEPRLASPPAITAFSVLGKRKALVDVPEISRPAKKATKASTKSDGKALAQMQISLGQEVQKRCKDCGMEYVASSAEDRKLHDKFHKQSTEGYDVGKDFVHKVRSHMLFPGAKDTDSICAIDCYDKHHIKQRAKAVLEIVQRELGAVALPENIIWDPHARGAMRPGRQTQFKSYLYIRGTKCVGFLLIEYIDAARYVVGSETVQAKTDQSIGGESALALLKARKSAAAEAAREAANRPIQLAEESHPAVMGVSRIWTSPHHRHQDIATTLLDTAVLHHAQRHETNMELWTNNIQPGPLADWEESLRQLGKPISLKGKEDVAFSQPTEAGARLARRWFGKLYGWSVYTDETVVRVFEGRGGKPGRVLTKRTSR